MNRYICIHGHFYQPPRENPWLEEVEMQDSAYPFHDWNSRITAECYAPNSLSRILDNNRKIIDLLNNYSKISFNFGPTLLTWLEKHNSEIYKKILEADKISKENFSGHGSALAQTYNHMIMPLANTRDKRTQIIWGIRDFEHRFKRNPEGMWLSETASDLETLDILAEYGIKFTILAPQQAKRVKAIKDKEWIDVKGSIIDPKIPYLCKLPSERTISLFFYDGPISQNIAFGELLNNGENFANRLIGTFTNNNNEKNELVHIATDGETYGHHHRFGDMALAYCIYHIESNNLAKMTIYGEYLEKNPPAHEVEIFENSSWSCIHGIERWRNNCGCNSGMHLDWNQQWRAPLRSALDWLRDNLISIYEEQMSKYINDPWKVRDEYINVILDRSDNNVEKFVTDNTKKALDEKDKVKFLKLLEIQRHAMLMYTSCGWFFDEISGIETTQIMNYAARTMQLTKEVSGISLEESFIKLLEHAPSNISGLDNGSKIYEMYIKPSITNLLRVGVHYAVSSLFKDYFETSDIYNYSVKKEKYERFETGKQKLAVGRIFMRSKVTWEQQLISFAVLHLGDHNIIGGAREYKNEKSFSEMYEQISNSFKKSEITETIKLIDNKFSGHSYSLRDLFKDEQRQILDSVFADTLKDIELLFRQIYDRQYPNVQVIESFGMPLPKYFSTVMEFIISIDISNILKAMDFDFDRFQKLVNEAKRWSLNLDTPMISYIVNNKIHILMEKLADSIEDIPSIENIISFLKTLENLPLNLNLWKTQNIYFSIGKEYLTAMKEKSDKNDENAKKWLEQFKILGDLLSIKIE